jgi:hypothetical protein
MFDTEHHPLFVGNDAQTDAPRQLGQGAFDGLRRDDGGGDARFHVARPASRRGDRL